MPGRRRSRCRMRRRRRSGDWLPASRLLRQIGRPGPRRPIPESPRPASESHASYDRGCDSRSIRECGLIWQLVAGVSTIGHPFGRGKPLPDQQLTIRFAARLRVPSIGAAQRPNRIALFFLDELANHDRASSSDIVGIRARANCAGLWRRPSYRPGIRTRGSSGGRHRWSDRKRPRAPASDLGRRRSALLVWPCAAR